MTSRTSEQSPRFGESLERPLARREDQIVGPLFSLGVSLAGTFLGEDSCLQPRIGSDDDLRNGTFPLGRSVEQTWLQDRLPRFRIRACSGIVQFQEAQFADSLLGRIGRRERYSSLVPSQMRVSCREDQMQLGVSLLVTGLVTVDGNI